VRIGKVVHDSAVVTSVFKVDAITYDIQKFPVLTVQKNFNLRKYIFELYILYLELNNSGTKYYDIYLIIRNLVIFLIYIKIFENLIFFIFFISNYEAD
jgi:hypothetical protein